MTQPARRLTLVDCLSIGINGVVGSGIYLLVAPLAKLAGPASVVGTAASAALCILTALCFAELGGMFDRSGGAYVYARAAFGPVAGFAVAWLGMGYWVVSFAAVAAGFGEQLSHFVPGLRLDEVLCHLGSYPLCGRNLVSVLLVVFLGVINYRGVRGGATTSNLLTAAKLIPLFALAIVGLAYVRGSTLHQIFSTASLPAAAHGNYWQAVSSSAFLAIFMMSGFETVAVPAGEAMSARRTIPIAIIGSLMGSALLYSLLQLACFSALPDVASSASPLPELAMHFFGPWAAKAMGIAALVSMAGYCAGSALVGPRYFSACATDGYLPHQLERMSRFGTPGAAVIFSTVLTAGLALLLGYTSLVDTANVAQFGQYIPVCLAVPVLRWRQPDAPRSYRIPFGPVVPILATASSFLLLWKAQPRKEEWIFTAQMLAVGVVVWTVTLVMKRARGPRVVTNP